MAKLSALERFFIDASHHVAVYFYALKVAACAANFIPFQVCGLWNWFGQVIAVFSSKSICPQDECRDEKHYFIL